MVPILRGGIRAEYGIRLRVGPEPLRQHAEQADAGLRAFAAWSAGDLDQAEAVRSAEKAADELQRQLQTGLREAFSTPLDLVAGVIAVSMSVGSTALADHPGKRRPRVYAVAIAPHGGGWGPVLS